jgi:acetyl-CoA carboxylase biotin carboxylase subunit
MRRALRETVIDGVTTTLAFHLRVLDDPAFQRGDVSTHFVPRMLAS